MNDFIAMFGIFGFFVFAALAFIAVILYLFLPFAIFGTKSLIDHQNKLIAEQNETLLEILESMNKEDSDE